MNDHELDEALAAAAPVRDDDLRSPATRAAVMAEMEEIVTMQTERDRTADRAGSDLPTKRTPRYLAPVAAVAAVGALIALLVAAPSGEFTDDQRQSAAPVASPTSSVDSGPPLEVELDARIISATRAALADSIMLQTQVDASGHVTRTWADEATGAMRIALTGADGGAVIFDSGPADAGRPTTSRQVDHCFAEYTEADGWTPTPRTEAEIIGRWLAAGDVMEDGTEEYEGREVIRLVWTIEDRVMLVDAETYRPLHVVGYPGTHAEYTQTYEFLERTDEHLAMLVPPVPEGFVLVDQLRGDGERLAAGCV